MHNDTNLTTTYYIFVFCSMICHLYQRYTQVQEPPVKALQNATMLGLVFKEFGLSYWYILIILNIKSDLDTRQMGSAP